MNGEKFKKTMQEYEVQTTASQILDSYAMRQEQRKAHKSKKNWWSLGAMVPATMAIALAAFFIFRSPGSITEHEIQDDSNNRVAFQLISGMELSSFLSVDNQEQMLRRRRPATDTEFIDIVNVYDKANDLVHSSYLANENIQKKVFEGSFDGKFKDKYPYKMEISGERDLVFYYDGKIEKDDHHELEMTIKGEIHYNQHVYRVLAESESSEKEKEYEVSIYFDEKNYIVIEQEEEANEFEYLYRIYENKKKAYEIEFKNEEGKQKLEIKENNNSYEFMITHDSTQDIIQYHALDAEGIMYLTYNQDVRIYTESETQQKIEKNSNKIIS